MARLLLIEDNTALAYGLRNNFEIEGYEVDVATDGHEAVRRAVGGSYDLVVLDLILPGIDGFGVLSRIAEQSTLPPVLVLSARDDRAAKLDSFRLGADDYVTKPFDLLELLARARALLRRSSRARDGASDEHVTFATHAIRRYADVIRCGDITIDLGCRQVHRAGEPVALRKREYELLAALATSAGAVLSRQRLLRDVWGYRADVRTRTVDVHVAQLRRKLERDPAHPRHIATVAKLGYRFDL